MSDESNQTQPTDPVEHNIDNLIATAKANPQVIPDKYKRETPEATIAEYEKGIRSFYQDYDRTKRELAELKKAREGAPATPPPEQPSQATPPQDSQLGLPKPTPETAPQGTALWDEVIKVVNEKGDIDDGLKSKILATGVRQEIVDAALRGMKVDRQNTLQKAYSIAGGEGEYKAIIDWAVKSLSPTEQAKVDADLRDHDKWEITFRGLKARRDETRIKAGEPVPTPQGTPNYGTTGLKPFANQHECMAAMRDPRYGKDPAYTREVEQRLLLAAQGR